MEKAYRPVFNYYCTWSNQGNWNIPADAPGTAQYMRDRMGHDFLFAADGVLSAHPTDIRRDMLVVLDDGWDVAPDTSPNGNGSAALFDSMIVDAEKFPEYEALSPCDRLVALSARIRALGYAGLGLWVPSNYFEEEPTADRATLLQKAKEFWTERGAWCAKADIRYLKVDWGFHGRDVEYRRIMTEAVKSQSPNTLIEHIIGIFDMPYDPGLDVQSSAPYRDFQALGHNTFAVADVFRTYDVVDTLASATTLMRVVKFFEEPFEVPSPLAGIINVEDEVVLAAALGMSMGIMRNTNAPCYLETVGALRWQRIAPPFRAASGQLQVSEELLCDRYFFDSDPEAWPYVGQKTIEQYAPARVSRCAPLPTVIADDEEHTPFVLCSKNPDTGAYSVAALSRVAPGRIKYRAPAAVTIMGAALDAPVGIFGSYRTLNIEFDRPIGEKRVLLQSLLCDKDVSIDVTDHAHIEGKVLTLDGAFLETFAAEALTEPPVHQDKSENALMLKLV